MKAVNGVTFSAFEGETEILVNSSNSLVMSGEITALLGHNGAGKTTTMSVLTGMFGPSSGSAVINGFNISDNMAGVRQSLGLCPQHNMLFEDLNVSEHLKFFGMLKGMTMSAAGAESEKYIKMLNLVAKKKVNVTNLSGGMKRKVNLGIALIGESRVVMLDEPTSGMDPEARREMWDLLNTLKKGRTILLTTHFMEEADVLGDRIAIMSRGKVKCFGSPFFLKKRFGQGYTLHVFKGDQFRDDERVTQIISSKVPSTQLIQTSEQETLYRLDTDHSPMFPDMFLELEKEMKQLGIVNFGLDLTTMDDVFLKIGEMEEDHDDESEDFDKDNKLRITPQKNGFINSKEKLVPQPLTGMKKMMIQMYGLIAKRMIYTWRRKILYISMMTIPIIMAVFIVLSLNPWSGNVRERPARLLELSSYKDPVTFISSDGSDAANSLQSTFQSLLTPGTSELTDDLDNTIIDEASGAANTVKYRERFIVAADFEEVTLFGRDLTQLTATYNSIPLHARPLAQNLVSNTLLRHLQTRAGNILSSDWMRTNNTHL